MTDSKRNVTIDIAKGIGMMLIVVLHACGPYGAYISRLFVPFFFIVSGYLYNCDSDLKTFTVKRVQGLYIPFVFWNVLGSTALAVTKFMPYTGTEFAKHILLTVLTVDKDPALFGGSWFIASLFVDSMGYKLLDTVTRRHNGRFTINLIVSILISLTFTFITLPMRMSRTLVLFVFYAAGVGLRQLKGRFTGMIKLPVGIITAVIYWVFITIIRDQSDFGTNVYDNRLLLILEIAAGSYTVVCLSKALSKVPAVREALTYVGQHTIDIVLWQFIVFRPVMMVHLYLRGQSIMDITKYYPVYEPYTWWWIIYTVFGIAGSLLIGEILRRGPWGKILKKIHAV